MSPNPYTDAKLRDVAESRGEKRFLLALASCQTCDIHVEPQALNFVVPPQDSISCQVASQFQNHSRDYCNTVLSSGPTTTPRKDIDGNPPAALKGSPRID